MRLPRFFKPTGDKKTGELAFAASEAESQEASEELPEELPDATWAERARAVLPMGTSTGSKRPEALWGSADANAPTHYLRAAGCVVTITDDQELIDCTMALGAVALGYADERVTGHVVHAAAHGNVAGLPHALEVEVAELFCEAVPCAEKVQFLKSGAEAVAAAVRLARTYTGRTRIVGCGYFGWLDWSAAEAGVPASVQADYTRVPFDDVAALERAVDAAGDELAAIVLEPVIERLPSADWIARARQLATQHGAVLIFDEVKTGFRLAPGGYQELAGVTPDLSAFGKALANGYALSAVCGNADIMDAATRTWISSTLAADTTALAAARAVLHLHHDEPVCKELARIGREMRTAVSNALRASRLQGIEIAGLDPMWFFRFESPALESRFLITAAANGVLFKRGPYNFAALAHDGEVIHDIEERTSNTLVAMRDEDGA
jgi:glutamate-1-semialdehyde 2,1-aminomutase